jgi:hypothetical protein
MHYDQMVENEDLPIAPFTLRRNFSTRINHRRYRKPRSKTISSKNKVLRVRYGHTHHKKTIRGFWQYVYFTDEAHFNSVDLSNKPEYELRPPDGEIRRERVQETHHSQFDVTLHVSAGISYNSKGVFQFYNDPKDPSVPEPYKRRKPRKGRYQTNESYAQEVAEWEASQPAEDKTKPKGNSMNLVFYTENILPFHINHIRHLEKKLGHEIYFQEDNDPSHGTRSKNNVAYQAKKASHLALLIHPAQSPDLNPQEGIWNLIKQRLRGGPGIQLPNSKQTLKENGGE